MPFGREQNPPSETGLRGPRSRAREPFVRAAVGATADEGFGTVDVVNPRDAVASGDVRFVGVPFDCADPAGRSRFVESSSTAP